VELRLFDWSAEVLWMGGRGSGCGCEMHFAYDPQVCYRLLAV
jgi:hypothetical protein